MEKNLIQQVISAEDLAKRFHNNYETFAPNFGYETRKESAKPWEEVPEKNRQLMSAVCEEILTFLCSCEGVGRKALPYQIQEEKSKKNPDKEFYPIG